MSIISILLLVVCVTSAVLLIVIVLLQDEEGEGFGGLFGGGSSTTFGSRSGNILTKFTSIIAVVFMFGTFSLAWVNRTPETGNIIRRARIESLQESEEDWWVQVKETESKGEGDGDTEKEQPIQASEESEADGESGIIRAGEDEEQTAEDTEKQ